MEGKKGYGKLPGAGGVLRENGRKKAPASQPPPTAPLHRSSTHRARRYLGRRGEIPRRNRTTRPAAVPTERATDSRALKPLQATRPPRAREAGSGITHARTQTSEDARTYLEAAGDSSQGGGGRHGHAGALRSVRIRGALNRGEARRGEESRGGRKGRGEEGGGAI